MGHVRGETFLNLSDPTEGRAVNNLNREVAVVTGVSITSVTDLAGGGQR
jgi:hypothetical protein